jgi:hypothetical protein
VAVLACNLIADTAAESAEPTFQGTSSPNELALSTATALGFGTSWKQESESGSKRQDHESSGYFGHVRLLSSEA